VPKTSEVTLGDKIKFDYEPQTRTLAYAEYQAHDAGVFESLRATVSYTRQEEGEQIIAAAEPLLESQELTDVATWGASVQLASAPSARQRLTYGFEYYRDRYDSGKVELDLGTRAVTPTTPGTPDGAHYESLGIYVQDEIRVGDDLELIPGLRWSRFDTAGRVGAERLSLTADELTASFNALYNVTRRLNLVGGIAQGFRAPNIEDFFGRVDFFSEIPNNRLQPEESLSREIGIKYLIGETSADLYYYESDYEGLIDRATVGTQTNGDPIVQRRNLQDAEVRGIEAGVNHRFNARWMLGATVAWTRGEDKQTGNPLRRIPPLNGTLRARYDHSSRFWLEGGATVAERQDRLSQGDIDDPRIPDGGTPGYAAYHLRGGWQRIPTEQLVVTLENLDDELYKTHGSGLYAPGRSMIVGYRIALE
jgi:outer membrane receptor protein involved in Fe transport